VAAEQPRDGVGDPDGPEATEEEPPGTDVEVEAHVHYGMTGTFPLRLGELFFADDGLYVAEYSYITPFIGLTTRKHRKEAKAMGAIYEKYGLDAVLVQADNVTWHNYDNVDRVVVHEGGWLGRPKIAVYPDSGPSHAFRVHDKVSWAEALGDLEGCAKRHPFDLEHRSGLGFTPRESIRRFFWQPDEEPGREE
jgi:hypothetical protein